MEASRADTLYSRFARWAPAAPAILAPGETPITFATLLAACDAMGAMLAAHGLRRGERIAVLASRGPDTTVAILGVACAATCVPVNPLAPAAECAAVLGETRARALVVAGNAGGPAADVARSLALPVLEVVVRDLAAPRGDAALPARDAAQRAAPDDVALLIRTSGTTAHPKRVPSTHSQLLARADKTRRVFGLGPHDRCVAAMPLCYANALYSAVVGSLAAGGSVVCPRELDADTFVRCVVELEATWYSAGATHQQAILDWLRQRPGVVDGHRLRFVRSGSGALPARVQAALENMLGVPVVEAYGTSETGLVTADSPHERHEPGTVGRSPDDDVAVVDPQGRSLPAGTIGEVVVRGPTVITGYDGDPETNRRAFRDGWYHTGDEGRLDADGRLTLTGRLTEIINRGGEKVSPAEVDGVLCAHPAVARAATFGVPHPRLGHEVAAAVVLRPEHGVSERELRRHLAERLTAFKVPRRIVITDAIPLGATGKVARHMLAEHFGLGVRPVVDTTATPLEATLRALWRDCLGTDVGIDDDFFLAGGDSLSAVTLLARLRTELDVELPLTTLIDAPTVRRLAAELERHTPGPARDLIGVNTSGTRRPLFGVCGRYGWALRLLLLGRALGPDQPFYGLQPPGMDWAGAGCRTLAEMAAHYVARIRTVQPHGPYRLVGTSFGGLVVFEMARALEAAGDDVEFLGLVDTQPTACRLGTRIDHPAAEPLNDAERELDALALDADAIEAAGARVAAAHVRARKAHVVDGEVRCPITYFLCTAEGVATRTDRRRLWRRFSRAGLRLHTIPGPHGHFHQEPQFSALASLLRACLDGDPPPPADVVQTFGGRHRLRDESLRFDDGRTVRLDGSVVQGWVDAITTEEATLVVHGWAVDRTRARPAERVIGFVDGRYAGHTTCGVRRDDVEHALAAPGTRDAGFVLRLRASAPSARVRVLALSGDEPPAELGGTAVAGVTPAVALVPAAVPAPSSSRAGPPRHPGSTSRSAS